MRSKTTLRATHPNSAGLAVESAGLIARKIKLHIFLVDPFVAIHAILFWVVIHGVIPPVEQGVDLRLVYRIPVAAAGIFPNQSARYVVDLTIAME